MDRLPRLLRTIILATCLWSSAGEVGAQATISGTVTMRPGGPGTELAGAEVEIASWALREVTTGTSTDAKGHFEFTGLPAGVYDIAFRHPGFGTVRRHGLAVVDTDSLTVDGQLSILECASSPEGSVCMSRSEIDARIPPRYRSLWDDDRSTVEEMWAEPACGEISMTVRGGFVWTPGSSYRVTFERGGRVVVGTRNADATETVEEGTISVFDYGRLCYLIEHMGFDQLNPMYAYAAMDTHQRSVEVSVRFGGRVVSVSDEGAMGPIELWAIQSAIERVRLLGVDRSARPNGVR